MKKALGCVVDIKHKGRDYFIRLCGGERVTRHSSS